MQSLVVGIDYGDPGMGMRQIKTDTNFSSQIDKGSPLRSL